MLIKRIAYFFYAFVMMLMAIIGFILPILPGIPFAVAAAALIRPKESKKIYQKIRKFIKR